MAELKIVPVI